MHDGIGFGAFKRFNLHPPFPSFYRLSEGRFNDLVKDKKKKEKGTKNVTGEKFERGLIKKRASNTAFETFINFSKTFIA